MVHCWASGMHWVAQLASAAAAGAGGRREACAKARNRNERCTDRRGGGVLVSCSLSWAASAGPLLLQLLRRARPGRAVERGGRRKWRGWGWPDGRLGARVRVSWGVRASGEAARRLAGLAGFAAFGAAQSPGAPLRFFFSGEKKKKKNLPDHPTPFLSRNLAKGAKGARRRWMPGAPPPAPSTAGGPPPNRTARTSRRRLSSGQLEARHQGAGIAARGHRKPSASPRRRGSTGVSNPRDVCKNCIR